MCPYSLLLVGGWRRIRVGVVGSWGRLEVNECGDGRIWWGSGCVDVIALVVFVGCECVGDDGGWGGVGKLGERRGCFKRDNTGR